MERKRDGLVPIGDALSSMGGPVKAIREASPQALHHFTQTDQVNQLVGASEAEADLGFMARTMALCSLPRTNPGNRLQYKRVNGPYKLIMIAGGDNKLPFGNLPPPAPGVALLRSCEDPKPGAGVGTVARQVHEDPGGLQQRRGPGSNQAPQPDAAALRLHRSTVLQG